MLGGEPCSGAGEARLHLVGDEHHAVGLAPINKRGKKSRCGHDEATLALHGLDDHGGQRGGADLGLDAADGGLGGGFAGQPVAVRVGRRHPVDLGCERAELRLVGHGLGGQRHRHVGAAVVGVVEGDDGLPAGGEPCHLDGVLHGFGARVEEGGALLVIAGGHGVEPLGEFHVALVRGDHETGVGEAGGLLGHRCRDTGMRCADAGDGDARAQVDERVSVDVDDDAAVGICRVDRCGRADAGRDGGLSPRRHLGRSRTGQSGHDIALLRQAIGDVGHRLLLVIERLVYCRFCSVRVRMTMSMMSI